jgi:hypothetical protein
MMMDFTELTELAAAADRGEGKPQQVTLLDSQVAYCAVMSPTLAHRMMLCCELLDEVISVGALDTNDELAAKSRMALAAVEALV